MKKRLTKKQKKQLNEMWKWSIPGMDWAQRCESGQDAECEAEEKRLDDKCRPKRLEQKIAKARLLLKWRFDRKPDMLTGERIVIAGRTALLSRDEIDHTVDQLGGVVRSCISDWTTCVIDGLGGLGDERLTRAARKGIPVVSEVEFMNAIARAKERAEREARKKEKWGERLKNAETKIEDLWDKVRDEKRQRDSEILGLKLLIAIALISAIAEAAGIAAMAYRLAQIV